MSTGKKIASASDTLDTCNYKLLVDSVKDYAIFFMDTNGTILTWNKGAEIIKGYTASEIIGKNVSAFYTEEEQKMKLPEKNLQEAKQNGSCKFEGWRVAKSGSLFWGDMTITALYDNENKLTGFVKITKAITEKKIQEDKFKGLLEAAPDAIVICNKNGEIEIINKQTEILFGFERSELIGKPIEVLIPEHYRHKHLQHRKKYMQTPGTRPMGSILDLLAVKKDGSMFPVEISLSPLKMNSHVWISAAVRDITERKRLTETLKRNNDELRKLASKIQNVKEDERTAMAREIHDELGQRLTALKIDMSWVLKRVDKHDEAIKQKSGEIIKMLDDTIKVVRRISSDLRPAILDNLGLIEALKWYSKDFEKRMGIHVMFNSEISDISLPIGITTGIFRIYQESLTNVARHAEAKTVISSILLNDEVIILTVTDDGKGFDTEAVTSKKTLGLLGISERALLMGGDAEIKSLPGKGTTLVVKVHLK